MYRTGYRKIFFNFKILFLSIVDYCFKTEISSLLEGFKSSVSRFDLQAFKAIIKKIVKDLLLF